MSNLYNPTRDLTGAQPGASAGLTSLFQCGKCSKRGATLGRKLKRVRGMRTWVCAACVQAEEKAAG